MTAYRNAVTLGSAMQRRWRKDIHRYGILPAGLHIAEFPKSGGTWVMQMCADLAAGSRFNSRARPVIHHHWSEQARYRPAVYVVRDGRDVCISLYFHHVRHIVNSGVFRNRANRHFSSALGDDYSVLDVRENLPAFIASLRHAPFGGLLRAHRNQRFLSWPDHVGQWSSREGVHVVRYEDLLRAPINELRRISDFLGLEIDDERLAQVRDRWSFESVSGRARGDEMVGSELRRGLAGEWRERFTQDAGKVFTEWAGSMLIELGYEDSDSWVASLPDE